MLDLQTQKAIYAVTKDEDVDISPQKLLYIFEKVQSFIYKYPEYRTKGYSLFRTFVEYMLTRNRSNFDSMLLITGDKGCLTDDTLIKVVDCSNKTYSKLVSIKDLLSLQKKDKRRLFVYSHQRFKKQNMLLGKPCDGIEFVKNTDVYRVTSSLGYSIKCTDDHPFKSKSGQYIKARNLLHKEVLILHNKNWVYDEIVSISYEGKENVYDVVNVRDNHNFIANGFVVSNTGKSSSGLMFARFWCYLLGIRFDEKKHIVYSNMQVIDAIDNLPNFSPILCDEAIDFASAQNWNKAENKKLKIKLGKVRTKHMFFILCWPWKINKLDKIYFESYVNYWLDLYKRGKGVVFVKDLNPISDPWKLDYFKKLGSFNEFTPESTIRKIYLKHPNFWNTISIPKPSDEFYGRYLKVRESNVYHKSDIKDSLSDEDITKAFIIKGFEDMFMKSGSAKHKRLVKHFQEMYQYEIKEKEIKECFDDSKQIVETAIEKRKYENYEVNENAKEIEETEE